LINTQQITSFIYYNNFIDEHETGDYWQQKEQLSLDKKNGPSYPSNVGGVSLQIYILFLLGSGLGLGRK
jgi:hypothetical protein